MRWARTDRRGDESPRRDAGSEANGRRKKLVVPQPALRAVEATSGWRRPTPSVPAQGRENNDRVEHGPGSRSLLSPLLDGGPQGRRIGIGRRGQIRRSQLRHNPTHCVTLLPGGAPPEPDRSGCGPIGRADGCAEAPRRKSRAVGAATSRGRCRASKDPSCRSS